MRNDRSKELENLGLTIKPRKCRAEVRRFQSQAPPCDVRKGILSYAKTCCTTNMNFGESCEDALRFLSFKMYTIIHPYSCSLPLSLPPPLCPLPSHSLPLSSPPPSGLIIPRNVPKCRPSITGQMKGKIRCFYDSFSSLDFACK